jgi:hypothetical protein
MGVFSRDAHVNRGPQGLTQRPEEMRYKLGRKSTDGITRKSPCEHDVRSARQIDRDLRKTLVHRQEKPIARDTMFGAKGVLKSLANRERTILNRMVLIDVKITLGREIECETTMCGQLLQHVVKESDARLCAYRRCGVEIDAYLHPRLPGFPGNFRLPGDYGSRTHAQARSSRSFSSAVPTLIRSASESPR